MNLGARHLRSQANIKPLLLEVTQRFLRNLLINDRQELGQRLEHDHFAAEPPPHAAELKANDAGADHAEALRHGLKIERAAGIYDVLAVKGRRAQLGRHGAGGEHHVLCRQLALAAVMRGELHALARQELAVALQRRDAAAL